MHALKRAVLVVAAVLVAPASALAETPYRADLQLASRAQLEAFAAGFPTIPSEHVAFPPIPAGYVGGGPGLVVDPRDGVVAVDSDWSSFCAYLVPFLQKYDHVTGPVGSQYFGNGNGTCRIAVGSHDAVFKPFQFGLNTIATVMKLFPVPGISVGDVSTVMNVP